MSLTTCLKQAGSALRPADKAAILALSRTYRADGLSPDEAGKKAIAEQIAAVQKLMAKEQAKEVKPVADEAPALTSPTQADILTQQQAKEDGEKASAKAKRDTDKKLADEQTAKDNASRFAGAVDNFKLGETADQNLSGQDAMFARGTADEKNLIIQHNLTAENLIFADRMGGLAVPSLAITKVDAPLHGFGEITLIGDVNMADPKQGIKAYGADIYSPRYPKITYELTDAKVRVMQEKFSEGAKATGRRIDSSELKDRGDSELVNSAAVMWQFLTDQGIKPDVQMKPGMEPERLARLKKFGFEKYFNNYDHQELMRDEAFQRLAITIQNDEYSKAGMDDLVINFDDAIKDSTIRIMRRAESLAYEMRKVNDKREPDEYKTRDALRAQIREKLGDKFEQYVKDQFASLNAKEKLFNGFTNDGDRRYKAHTLENVISILKKELRGGENFNYGAGSLRAKFTPQFRSVAAIRAAKDTLVSKEQFEAIKDEVNKELIDISDALNTRTDTAIAIFEDAPKMGLKRAAKEYGIDLGDTDAQRMAQFMTRLRNMPTEYFEGKMLRAMPVKEFKAAVVPEGISAKTLEILNRDGVKVFTYKKGDEADRARAVKQAAEATPDALFSRGVDANPNRVDTSANGTPDTRPEAAANLRVLGSSIARHLGISGAKLSALHPYDARVLPGDAALREVAQAFGSRIQGFDLSPRLLAADRQRFGFFSGVRTGGIVFVNSRNADRAHIAVLGHELAHELATKNPALYQQFVDAVRPYVDQQKYAQFLKSEVAVNAGNTGKQREEFMGEVLSDGFMDREFWRALGSKNPSLLQKIGNSVMDLVERALRTLGYTKRTEPYLTDYKKVMQIAGEVMAEFGVAPTRAAGADTRFAAADQTDTAAFKRWFDASKVVDDKGRPLRVFHGTNKNESGEAITSFDTYGGNYGLFGLGAYFTENADVASSYTKKGKGTTPTVYSAYLSIKNPIDMDAKANAEAWQKAFPDVDFASDYKPAGDTNEAYYRSAEEYQRDNDALTYEAAEELQGGLVSMGYDGLTHIGGGRVKSEGVKHRVYIAFESEQIKSATGNSGGFDPTNPDIRFARGTANLFQPNIWSAPADTRTDKIIHLLQDSKVDLKRVQEVITKSGQVIDEKWDARLAETLYPGRVAHRSQNFLEVEAQPLLEAMMRNKVSMDELADYLHARGAEERNVQIAKVNPAMPDGGAGTNTKGTLLTTQAARDYLTAISPTRKMVLDAMAKRVDAITAGTRTLLVSEGLEKQETIDAWTAAYKNYVPMFRDEADEGFPSHPQGSGFAVKGSASKRAMGSTKEVTNILAHVLMQREAAITRAEKNRVALALYGQALSHPNPEFWTTIKPGMQAAAISAELVAMGVDPMTAEVGMAGVPTIQTIDPNSNKVVNRPNPMYRMLPGAIPLKVNGEDRVLMLNVKNERGARLAASLKNLDGLTQLDLAGSIVGRATRFLAAVNTQYNPAFGLVNLTRDTLGGAINLGSTELRGNALKVLAQTPGAIFGIARELAMNNQAGKWGKLYRQFQDDGGQTGFKENFRDPNDRAKAINKELQALGRSKLSPGQYAHYALDLLDGFNTTLENAVRLSAYSAGLDKGMSRPQAARLGRELTVDFNRKGRLGREVGPLYAFFNASVQGSARTIVALKGPTGAKIIAGGLSLGILQAIMLAAAGYDDDEIPEFVKTRALIIPLLGGDEKKYISIPYPLGLHVIPNTSRVLTELVLNGGKDIGKRSVAAIGEIAGAFNPLGGTDMTTKDGWLKMVAPTVVDPFIEMLANKNFAGREIEKKGFGSETDNRPGVNRARESTQRSTTGQAYIEISKAMNTATGGNDYEKGAVSPTPEMLRYMAQTVGGGVLRELEKGINASTAASRGEKTKMSQIPVVGRFYGEVDDDSVQRGRYYEADAKMKKLTSVSREIKKSGTDAELDAYEKAHPEIELEKDFQRTRTRIAKLNKFAVETINNPKELASIDADRAEEMRELNADIKQLEKASGKLTPAEKLRDVVKEKAASWR